jgi:hypothetical protein
MEVGHSYQYYLHLRWFIHNAVRKPLHLTAADRVAKRMPRQWKLLDSSDCLLSVVAEFLT